MKKIKKSAIIVLMITFFIILGNKSYATTGTINSETVRLRKESNTTSTILEQLDHGDEVEILEQEEGWYKVKVTVEGNTLTGYISEKLIDVEEDKTQIDTNNQDNPNQPDETIDTSTEPEENNGQQVENVVPSVSMDVEESKEYTLEQSVKIKAMPLMNSIEKAEISGNIKVIEIINDWAKIEKDLENGWIRINSLKKSITKTEVDENQPEPSTETNPEESTTDGNEDTTAANATVIKTAYVSVDGLRVREKATTSSKEIDSLKKNHKVEIISEEEGWYKIKINGEIGYVSAKYISDKKVEETTSRGSSADRTMQTNSQVIQSENTSSVEETPVIEESPKVEEPTTTGTTGAAIVEFAKQYLGYKYVSGGASPSTGFDCSGFTTYVYKHFGISLYRTSRDQIKNGVAVDKSNLQLGDIVVFNNESNTAIGHVGIYIGDGNFIHAANRKEGVKITALSSSYYQTRYVGARRVI